MAYVKKNRVINFPNRGSAAASVEEETVATTPEIKIPRRPRFIPKKYAVEWAEMCIELMGRKRWSSSMMPLLEAAMVGRVVFDETDDLMEKLEAQKVIFKYYKLLDLIPKREPGHAGRPRLPGVSTPSTGNEDDNGDEKPVMSKRWGL